jgi:hypothetical protein
LVFLRKVGDHRLSRIILFYLIFDFLINVALGYFIPIKYHNKVYPVFTIIESLFFAGLFYTIIKKQSLRKLIIVATIVFSISLIVYYYYNYIVLKGRPVLDSIPIGIETILIFVFTFFYFYEQMNDTTSLFIYSKPSFWAVLGILLYLAGSFFIYIFANQVTVKELGKYWIITNISSILKNIFFTIAIYIQANQPVKKQSRNNYNLYPSN